MVSSELIFWACLNQLIRSQEDCYKKPMVKITKLPGLYLLSFLVSRRNFVAYLLQKIPQNTT